MKVSTQYGAASGTASDQLLTPSKPSTSYRKFVALGLFATAVIAAAIYLFSISAHKGNNLVKNTNSAAWLTGTFGTTDGHGYDMELLLGTTRIHTAGCEEDGDTSYDETYGTYTYDEDIQATMNTATNFRDWVELSDALRAAMGDDVDEDFIACFKEQVLHGSIECVNCDSDVVGYNDGSTMFLCKENSFEPVDEVSRPFRRSCVIMDIAEQSSLMCESTDAYAQTMAEAAFEWYKAKWSKHDSFTIEDCQ